MAKLNAQITRITTPGGELLHADDAHCAPGEPTDSVIAEAIHRDSILQRELSRLDNEIRSLYMKDDAS